MALYQGLTTSIVGIIPYAGIDLAVNSLLKEAVAAHYQVISRRIISRRMPSHHSLPGRLPPHTHYALTMHSLCTHYTPYQALGQEPSTHYALTMHSPCTHCALAMHSLCTHYALAMHSLCTQYTLTIHSLCTHYTPYQALGQEPGTYYARTMHSPCTHCAFTMHSLYTHYALIVHSLYQALGQEPGTPAVLGCGMVSV
jgi:hypothetical protein